MAELAARLPKRIGLPAALVAISIAAGGLAAASTLGWVLALFSVALAAVLASALHDWRRAAILLIAYIPYSGLVGLVLYPRTYLGEIVRDLLIVAPLYVGFFAMRRERSRVPHFVLFPLALLALMATVQLVNPSLPSLSVGFVGLRAWVFFIPLLAIGAVLAHDVSRVHRLMKVWVIAGLPVLVIGIVEALLFAAGQASLVFRVYGDAAAAAFATRPGSTAPTSVSIGSLHRVSSLFTYPEAFYFFCMAMLVPSYFLWRSGVGRATRRLGGMTFLAAILAVLASGVRFAYIGVPIALLVTAIVEGVRVSARTVVPVALAAAAVAVLLHVPLLSLPQQLYDIAAMEAGDVLGEGLRAASDTTWLGLGPGTNTNAVRIVAGTDVFELHGRWRESHLAKAWLELGVPGMIVSVWALLAVTWAVVRGAGRATRARPLLAIASGFLVQTVAVLPKGAVLDQAPASVYFWLIAGIGIAAHRWPAAAEPTGEGR